MFTRSNLENGNTPGLIEDGRCLPAGRQGKSRIENERTLEARKADPFIETALQNESLVSRIDGGACGQIKPVCGFSVYCFLVLC